MWPSAPPQKYTKRKKTVTDYFFFKEQYQGMIAEKLRMIKAKSTEPSPILTAISNATIITNPILNLTPQEISQISIRLQQIRPQIPQIDKLLLLHSKLINPPLSTLEMIKKLTDCRNILVNQIEISVGGGRKNFVMSLSQLNLLIEQVQRLFNSLVSKMKESAGVSPVLMTTSNSNASVTKSTNTANTTNTSYATNTTNTSHTHTNNPQISSSALSTTSSLHNSSNSSLSSSSKQKLNLKSSQNSSATNNNNSLLLQRLSLPPDDITTNLDVDNWLKRLIAFNSARKPAASTINQKHLKQRNRLLIYELKSLNQNYHIQDCGLGNLNVLISKETHRFIFQISQKYPYEQLIYRIETKSNTNNKEAVTLLPKNREPITFPLTITSILRNFKE